MERRSLAKTPRAWLWEYLYTQSNKAVASYVNFLHVEQYYLKPPQRGLIFWVTPGLLARDHVSPKFVSQSGYASRTSGSSGARRPCRPFIWYSGSHAAEGIIPGSRSGAQSQWLSPVRHRTPLILLSMLDCFRFICRWGRNTAQELGGRVPVRHWTVCLLACAYVRYTSFLPCTSRHQVSERQLPK